VFRTRVVEFKSGSRLFSESGFRSRFVMPKIENILRAQVEKIAGSKSAIYTSMVDFHTEKASKKPFSG
jgi:hypothetical protein